MKTMICFILDRSGSMAGRESDVIGGVNAFLDKQRALPDPATIAFVRFDNHIERFRQMENIAWATPLKAEDFKPRGGTALLDAIGSTIATLELDWNALQPDRAIVVVVTDGEENSSCQYTKAGIKEMIEARQASGKWAFIYLGADVDAFHEGGKYGFVAANTAGYVKSAKGIHEALYAASETMSFMRATGSNVANNLGKNIAEDEGEGK